MVNSIQQPVGDDLSHQEEMQTGKVLYHRVSSQPQHRYITPRPVKELPSSILEQIFKGLV
jgi:hypothetical protein